MSELQTSLPAVLVSPEKAFPYGAVLRRCPAYVPGRVDFGTPRTALGASGARRALGHDRVHDRRRREPTVGYEIELIWH